MKSSGQDPVEPKIHYRIIKVTRENRIRYQIEKINSGITCFISKEFRTLERAKKHLKKLNKELNKELNTTVEVMEDEEDWGNF